MTLEHQTRMNNLMTRIGWDARIALREGNGKLDEAARERLDAEIDEHGRLYALSGRSDD